jgi:hypothetical protein
MVFYILLTIVFIAVFGWLTWRIVMRQVPVAPRPEAAYVCPVCNDDHCICHKTDGAP